MRKILPIFAATLLLASCGGEKPTPEPQNPVPSAPAGLVVHTATENGLSFQWEDSQYATSYAWELQQDGTNVKEGTTKNHNAIISGLTKATDYRFGVKAVNENGTSSVTWVNARTAGTIDPPQPPTPEGMAYADFAIPSYEEDGLARAFPGAEGGGMWVTGGRGGKVIHVTNLNDSGSGSLRAAINEKGARTIVFDVAGIIELQSTLKISNGDVTIAGQTAPGDGICLKNYCFRINANNVIVRYIRCRMGDEKQTEDDAMNLYTGNNDLQDVIIDHCSLSWSTDECGSFYGMTNFSLQWCILSESLRNSVHGKGKHGYGGIWGGSNATYHHNLLAHHDSRNPRLDHDYVSTLKGPVSLVNNVIYNWGDNSTYGGESANDINDYKKYNLVNNYYKPGPATVDGKVRFIDPWTKACDNCTKKTGSSTIVPGHFYLDGNVMDGNAEKTGDNWKGTTASDAVIAVIKATAPFAWAEKESKISLHQADLAFTQVLAYAGASLKRDAVDKRIANETKNGNYTYKGSNGSTNGFIDTQADVGGWPAYAATADELANAKDTDGDGIPDWFEDMAGLDKASETDGAAKTLDKYGRYTNLEMYLHYLVRDIVASQSGNGTYTKL
jgi:pectate lyase